MNKDQCIQAIIDDLANTTTIESSRDFAAKHNCDHDLVIGAIKSLAAEGYVLDPKPTKKQSYSLTQTGRDTVSSGSPEVKFFNSVTETTGSTEAELMPIFDNDKGKFTNGKKNAMKLRWIGFTKQDGGRFNRLVAASDVADELVRQLQHVEAQAGALTIFDDLKAWPGQKKKGDVYKTLKKRKMAELISITSFSVIKGTDYQSKFVKAVANLTKDMINTNAWKTTSFKKYNFKSLGSNVGGGALHPLMKVRTEFRKILLQMGFEEMPTNRYVESSFWNFDALFQPQQHPARDAHDTFFLESPANALKIPEDYMKKVKETHENGGGYGSIGYRYDWKEEEARKNVLRTHTTAISSQMLYKLGQECQNGKPFTPKKYFSIDRVFRNETMDATHLAEFHQVEGLVADVGLGIGDLKGIIHAFFLKIGISKLRFKPAFNPYTEPSMEIFGYQPELKKWIEIGNSGIFRPEMVQPMGLPKDVRVIAWGLSLERPTMIKYHVANIRDLFGHKCKIVRTKKAPICRFDDLSGV